MRGLCYCAAWTLLLPGAAIAAEAPAGLKTETFDRDPGWGGYRNSLPPKKPIAVQQDFGYSATNHAGHAAGEMGGRVQRATKPASYAAAIPVKTLDDPLSASGSFAVTASQGAGAFFGWFAAAQPGGSGRPVGSLGMNFDFESSGGRLAVRLITGANRSCGTFITPFIPGKYRPTPIKNDGTRYHWTMAYDPAANSGAGRCTFSIKSESATPEEFEGKEFTFDLPAGFRQEEARFDRFGLMNLTKSGGAATLFFDDLAFDGHTEDFSTDPKWIGEGNREKYEETEVAGAQQFGFSPTSHAGGAAGEIGGIIWRSPYAYYADRVGPLDATRPLEASGRVVLLVGAPDSNACLGWFSSTVTEVDDHAPNRDREFLGIEIGGPTRVGHYFLPSLLHAGQRHSVKSGPILRPGQPYEWTFAYRPPTAQSAGRLQVTLGGETASVDLPAGALQSPVQYDRFGLTSIGTGGGQVKIYLDDLRYTVAP